METLRTAGNITAFNHPLIVMSSGIPQVRIPGTSLVAVVEDLDNKEYVLKKIQNVAQLVINQGNRQDRLRIESGLLPHLNDDEHADWLPNPNLVEMQMLYYRAYVTGERVQYQLSLLVDIARKLRATSVEVRQSISG